MAITTEGDPRDGDYVEVVLTVRGTVRGLSAAVAGHAQWLSVRPEGVDQPVDLDLDGDVVVRKIERPVVFQPGDVVRLYTGTTYMRGQIGWVTAECLAAGDGVVRAWLDAGDAVPVILEGRIVATGNGAAA